MIDAAEDHVDYQQMAADPSRSAFVMANAGTGKTYTLVSRVARLLLAGAEPDTILCVTFTKAAAAEMQRRLFERLGGWAVAQAATLRDELGRLEDRAPDSFSREEISKARTLFAKALDTPGGLKILTIHAFCEKLLRRFPLEAGVPPGFTVMDDAAAALIQAEARQAVAHRALSGGDLTADAYASFAVSLDFEAFASMFAEFEVRRQEIAEYIARCGGLSGLTAAVAESVGLARLEDVAEIERRAVTPPELDPAAWFAAAKAMSLGSEKTDQPRGRDFQAIAETASRGEALPAEVFALFFTDDGPRKSLCTKQVDAPASEWLLGEQQRLTAVLERIRANRVALDTIHALVLASVYADAYDRAKQVRGVLDFGDLIARARALVAERRDAAWVLYKLDRGIDHILVDEAQDTAPAQWDIVRAFAGEFFAGEGGARDPRAPGRTLFVVGDEKQSIFSFQGAAPERLREEELHYQRMLEGQPHELQGISLVKSRRSVPEVLALVDQTFFSLELAKALQPRHPDGAGDGDIVRHLTTRDADAGCVDLWPLAREEGEGERRAWDEPLDAAKTGGAYEVIASRIASEIHASVERGDVVHPAGGEPRPANAGDFIVLVRKRKAMFEAVIRALREKGLPVSGADRLELSSAAIFDDLLGLARFVLFPGDDLTLAALLRSPFCDVPEEGPGGLFELAYHRRGNLRDALRTRAHEHPAWRAAERFFSFAQSQSSSPPFEFFARVLAWCGETGWSMRRRLLTRLGPESPEALEAFLAEVLAAERQGARDLERLAHALATAHVTVKREMDEPRGEVRVMTAHGAKGLEAPVIFLPETVGERGRRSSPLLPTEDGGFLWSPSKASDCAASRAARDRCAGLASAESLRLLYVALTRARDRVVVAGRINARDREENVKGWWKPLCQAFERPAIAEHTREIETSDGWTFRRFGSDPRTISAAGAEKASEAALPGWAYDPPAAEPPVSRYASPSRLADEAPARTRSPLERVEGLAANRRGDLIHRLLQLLPDLTPEARSEAAARMLGRERDLSDTQRAEIAAAVFGVLDDHRFAEVFGPGSRPEVAVAGGAAGLPAGLKVSGRLDRLVVTPRRVLVIDFKSNRPSPDRIEDADPAYVLQMAVYAAVLRDIYPDRPVEAALVWTDGPKLMPVPKDLMAQALARLPGAS